MILCSSQSREPRPVRRPSNPFLIPLRYRVFNARCSASSCRASSLLSTLQLRAHRQCRRYRIVAAIRRLSHRESGVRLPSVRRGDRHDRHRGNLYFFLLFCHSESKLNGFALLLRSQSLRLHEQRARRRRWQHHLSNLHLTATRTWNAERMRRTLQCVYVHTVRSKGAAVASAVAAALRCHALRWTLRDAQCQRTTLFRLRLRIRLFRHTFSTGFCLCLRLRFGSVSFLTPHTHSHCVNRTTPFTSRHTSP